MDSSGSMTTSDFLKQKRFIQHLTRKFSISNRGAHVGVIAYSTRASIAISLKRHRRWPSFARAVGRIPFARGDTRIDLALAKAQVIFRATHGGRSGLPKVLIVLTDGQQSMVQGEEPQLDRLVLPLRKQGVKVYAIGIGR
jgi:Mg-chelatase subunit ChlD